MLTDIIDPNTLFINGTVTVNDVPLPFANPNTGIPLGDFQPNDAIINFQVVITGGQINNLVTNTAIANGLATVNPNEPPVVVEGDSNTVVIPFIPQNVSTTVVKRQIYRQQLAMLLRLRQLLQIRGYSNTKYSFSRYVR